MDRRHEAALLVASSAAEGSQMPNLLRALRENGYSMGESSVALAEGLDIDLGTAQRIVLESQVWADHQVTQAQAEEQFWEALEELGKRTEDGSIEINLSDFD